MTAETEAFRAFMMEARTQYTELQLRLASCEEKHAKSEAERHRLEAEVAAMRERIAHLERATEAAGKSLGARGADDKTN